MCIDFWGENADYINVEKHKYFYGSVSAVSFVNSCGEMVTFHVFAEPISVGKDERSESRNRGSGLFRCAEWHTFLTEIILENYVWKNMIKKI